MSAQPTAATWRGPGWDAAVRAWIAEQQAALGLPATGPVELVRARPWSALLRAPTAAGWLWFKANTPASAYEARLVAALATWAPDAVLTPLAVDPERGWLLSPDGGPTLRDAMGNEPDLPRWAAMLAAYAELQRKVAGNASEMLAFGVPDLRPARMPARLAGLLADPAIQAALGADRQARLLALAPEYARWCEDLAADGIAASLQHDDLSAGNVFPAESGYRFFDWGDACVAHPFGSLLVALYVVIDTFKIAPRAPEVARLRDAYLEPWTADRRDRASLLWSATLAMRVAKVSRALSWQRALSGAIPPLAPQYATAVPDWLAELTEPDV